MAATAITMMSRIASAIADHIRVLRLCNGAGALFSGTALDGGGSISLGSSNSLRNARIARGECKGPLYGGNATSSWDVESASRASLICASGASCVSSSPGATGVRAGGGGPATTAEFGFARAAVTGFGVAD